MSNKAKQDLNELDRILRELKPVDTSDKTKLTISMVNGFELHNSRPYHNYENWADGYIVEDEEIKVSAEDLDDAVYLFKKVKENPIEQPWYLKDKDERIRLLSLRGKNYRETGKFF